MRIKDTRDLDTGRELLKEIIVYLRRAKNIVQKDIAYKIDLSAKACALRLLV